MKIAVTGGQGFIGSNFIRYMLSEYNDLDIINIDNMSTGSSPDSLKDIQNNSNYRLIKGDIADYDLVAKTIQSVDTVVNFAAETHVDRSIADPSPFVHTNVHGVFTLLEAIRRSNRSIRLLHISTDEVYGDIEQGSFCEDSMLTPSNPYSATKAAADLLAMAYHRTYSLNIVITRCTNNFGPFQFPEKLIPKTIVRASMNLPIPVYGSGSNVRDWLYVLDHCEALDLVLAKGKNGQVYNISAGNELSNMEIVGRVLRAMRKPDELVRLVEDRPGHDLRYSLESSKLRKELGWSPRYSLGAALEVTVDWYVRNEWWWKPLATEQVLHPTPWKLR